VDETLVQEYDHNACVDSVPHEKIPEQRVFAVRGAAGHGVRD
jgi:hypothetical protein